MGFPGRPISALLATEDATTTLCMVSWVESAVAMLTVEARAVHRPILKPDAKQGASGVLSRRP